MVSQVETLYGWISPSLGLRPKAKPTSMHVGRLRARVVLVGLDRLDLVAGAAVGVELVDVDAVLGLEAVDHLAVVAPVVRAGRSSVRLPSAVASALSLVRSAAEAASRGCCERRADGAAAEQPRGRCGRRRHRSTSRRRRRGRRSARRPAQRVRVRLVDQRSLLQITDGSRRSRRSRTRSILGPSSAPGPVRLARPRPRSGCRDASVGAGALDSPRRRASRPCDEVC